MSHQISVRVWDENWLAMQKLIAAHDAWLTLAAVRDPELAGGDGWKVADVVNVALREYCARAAADFDKTRELLQKEADHAARANR